MLGNDFPLHRSPLQKRLTVEDVAAAEAVLDRDPEDVTARVTLVGDYVQWRRPRWVQHALWVIEHVPDHEIAREPLFAIWNHLPEEPAAVALWERAIENGTGRPGVFLNAAQFFRRDLRRRTALLERGEREAPTWPEWGYLLGNDAMEPVEGARRRQDRGKPTVRLDLEIFALAEAALAHYERALGHTESADWRLALLPRCAVAALESVRLAEAQRYADATIVIASESLDYRRVEYLHVAHIVRGHVALANQDLPGACAELAAAGEITVDRSYGPDFRLARLLVQRDEVDAVVAYLDRCAFWRPELVAKWRDALARGEIDRLYR